mgnify:CR=1 FL=1
MGWRPPSLAEIKDLINTAKTVAIVGVSNKEDRPSHGVAKALIESGDYEIYLVNPLYDERKERWGTSFRAVRHRSPRRASFRWSTCSTERK